MRTTEVPWDDLDPGIRRLVRLLVDNDFETTDSGDGVSKFDADGKPLPGWESDDPSFEWVMRVPHVWIRTEPAVLAAACNRLMGVLEDAGVTLKPIGFSEETPCIQGTYDPMLRDPDDGQRFALICLTGVSDADLREEST